MPIVLVGNKKDLHMERMISYDEGKRLAESWKAGFVEASAKQNDVSFALTFNTNLHALQSSKKINKQYIFI